MDLFSRKNSGLASGPTIHRELVLNAVMIADRRRRPRGTMIHSDRVRKMAATPGGGSAGRIASSMSRKGNCWARGGRVFLRQPEERANQEADLQDPSARGGRSGGLHQCVLQSDPSS